MHAARVGLEHHALGAADESPATRRARRPTRGAAPARRRSRRSTGCAPPDRRRAPARGATRAPRRSAANAAVRLVLGEPVGADVDEAGAVDRRALERRHVEEEVGVDARAVREVRRQGAASGGRGEIADGEARAGPLAGDVRGGALDGRREPRAAPQCRSLPRSQRSPSAVARQLGAVGEDAAVRRCRSSRATPARAGRGRARTRPPKERTRQGRLGNAGAASRAICTTLRTSSSRRRVLFGRARAEPRRQ